MQYLKGYIIKRHKTGSKKGQKYVKWDKRYCWFIPDPLENKIQKGDTVLARVETYSEEKQKNVVKAVPVLVSKIYESEKNEKRSFVLKVLRKNRKKKDSIEYIEKIIDRAVQAEIIVKAASWYKYDNKVLAQGKTKTANYLNENIDLYKKIKTDLYYNKNKENIS